MTNPVVANNDRAVEPEEAAALRAWEASGRPPIPLVTDREGDVHRMTTRLEDVLSGGRPSGARYRAAALAWVAAHCANQPERPAPGR